MKDPRDDNTELRDTGMGNPGTRYYKGTDIPVPERNEDGYYDTPGACPLCGRYTCNSCK